LCPAGHAELPPHLPPPPFLFLKVPFFDLSRCPGEKWSPFPREFQVFFIVHTPLSHCWPPIVFSFPCPLFCSPMLHLFPGSVCGGCAAHVSTPASVPDTSRKPCPPAQLFSLSFGSEEVLGGMKRVGRSPCDYSIASSVKRLPLFLQHPSVDDIW